MVLITQRRLFICTKPYQHLISRLIIKGNQIADCDLLVLNHFDRSREFVRAVKRSGVWKNVYWEDDRDINEKSLKLSIFQKYSFYNKWKLLLPECFQDISKYSELYFAHDSVPVEYAVMRKFKEEGKKTYLFEEGFSNYASVNEHKQLFKMALKEIAHWFGVPGSYLGRLKWTDTILLQRPELLARRKFCPIRKKVKSLPIPLVELLTDAEFSREIDLIYPELTKLVNRIDKYEKWNLCLTDPYLDLIQNREQYFEELIKHVSTNDGHNSVILMKQHPGEKLKLPLMNNVFIEVPSDLPIELLYCAANRAENLRTLNIFTFGSTATINLYELFKKEYEVNVILLVELLKRSENKQLYLQFLKFKKIAINSHTNLIYNEITKKE